MNIITTNDIENRIYAIRGKQVMTDRDLAALYQVETKVLNQAVKRNIARFPESFRFQLKENEYNNLRSQIVTSNENHGGRRYLPYVFTEQGIAMLSAVLKSDIAIQVSIQIMQAFVNMRKFMIENASVFQRLNQIERRQSQTDEKIELVFKALNAGQPQPEKGIFFDGQIFDAYVFISGLIKKARKSITLIDNYVDETVFALFSKTNKNVSITIFTKNISKALQLDAAKYAGQYSPIQLKILKNSHDRFLIIDEKYLYHIGASLKDVGKKWFAFSRMDELTKIILENLKS